jgi:hypothetical protein
MNHIVCRRAPFCSNDADLGVSIDVVIETTGVFLVEKGIPEFVSEIFTLT